MDHGDFSQLQNPYININLDRLPQWSHHETQNFLVIRAELDPNFIEIKRNKLLWELVSARMSEIGFTRTPVQCKSKWKNLVTRYKRCITMQEIEMRQQAFPFYNEMKAIFDSRMQRMQEAESGATPAAPTASPSDDEGGRERKKRKEKKTPPSSTVEGLKEVMEEYMKQQMEMEKQWIKAYEERERRRREREMEWRQRMEAIENERLMMMRRWREHEEQRKTREEARSARRDALITALLNKIRRDYI